MPISTSRIDALLRALRQFGPYGVFLGFGGLAWAFFNSGAPTAGVVRDRSAIVMRGCGAALAAFTVLGLVLWHFCHWPPWMRQLSEEPKASPKKKQKQSPR